MPNGSVPNTNVLTTTNQYLAGYWMDLVLRDNYFFGKVMQKEMRKQWRGSQVLVPMKYQKGVASVAFNGFDLLPITQLPTTVNMTFYPTFVAKPKVSPYFSSMELVATLNLL